VRPGIGPGARAFVRRNLIQPGVDSGKRVGSFGIPQAQARRLPTMSSDTPVHFDHPPRPLVQRLGAILWPSFFAAGVATMVFFAFVDPLALQELTFPDWAISREFGYSFGFFVFWLCTASSSLFTWILLRPASRFNRPLPEER
jgi:hypothetical protein